MVFGEGRGSFLTIWASTWTESNEWPICLQLRVLKDTLEWWDVPGIQPLFRQNFGTMTETMTETWPRFCNVSYVELTKKKTKCQTTSECIFKECHNVNLRIPISKLRLRSRKILATFNRIPWYWFHYTTLLFNFCILYLTKNWYGVNENIILFLL